MLPVYPAKINLCIKVCVDELYVSYGYLWEGVLVNQDFRDRCLNKIDI